MLILPVARITSGVSATNSMVYLRMSSALPAAGQRISLRTFAALGPAQLLQSLLKRCDAGLPLWTVRNRAHEDAYLPHPIRLREGRKPATWPRPRAA